MMARAVAIFLAAAVCASAIAGTALAHPHVWVTANAEIAYDSDGRVSALRHVWRFDEFYSAYVLQGLPREPNGEVSPAALAELAQDNAVSLVDFGYFSEVKIDGRAQDFAAPTDYAMNIDGDNAVLTFTLPLVTPEKPRAALVLEVYDPEFFVAFRMAESADAVRLAGGPAGCAVSITRPKEVEIAQAQSLSEAFFETLTNASNFGADFANRALVACP